MPSETINKVEGEAQESVHGDDRSLAHIERNTAATGRDDGSVIDIMCMYTREALVELCNEMKGNNCGQKYVDYASKMKQRCELGVDQTVS